MRWTLWMLHLAESRPHHQTILQCMDWQTPAERLCKHHHWQFGQNIMAVGCPILMYHATLDSLSISSNGFHSNIWLFRSPSNAIVSITDAFAQVPFSKFNRACHHLWGWLILECNTSNVIDPSLLRGSVLWTTSPTDFCGDVYICCKLISGVNNEWCVTLEDLCETVF